jgi:hypothetical protein
LTVFDAAAALVKAEPQLLQVALAGEALRLAPRELLHAGPPLGDPTQPPAPLRSAAVMTALHEGWAADEAEAEAMLANGALKLSPAQARGCVTPLAAVVSAGTPLFGVGCGGAPVWAPVSPLGGPDTRMGHRDPSILARLVDRDRRVAPTFERRLLNEGPVPLWPLAAAGLAAGDDLHSRTTGAAAAFATAIVLPTLNAELRATPLFFLTIWMAACAALLRVAEGGDRPHWVTRVGGNGERFGLALAGEPDRWHTVPATAPTGWRLPLAPADAPVSPAIGDSAVIDLLGFGGQRLAWAPEPLSALADQLPPGHAMAARRLLQVPNPALPDAWPLAVDAAACAREGLTPWVCLAMLAADGRGGLLGRGVWPVPMPLLMSAVQATGGA